MSWRPLASASAARRCPVCASRAIGTRIREDVQWGPEYFLTTWLLRCGECETWRRCRLTPRATHVLERRLRRDCRRIARELCAMSSVDLSRELAGLIEPALRL